MDLQEAKARICDEVDRRADTLIAASHEIHDHPEVNFDEHHAHDLLTDAARGRGARPSSATPTASTPPSSPRPAPTGPRSRCCCEYDALPGHRPRLRAQHHRRRRPRRRPGRCGRSPSELGGRVRILGTPAEEGGGGKVFMVERGAFDGVDAAMMVHPADADLPAHDRHRHPAARGRLPRPRGPRRGRPVEGPQRPRRRRARLHERGRPAPAHPPRRAGPRHLHRRRATSPTSCPPAAAMQWYVRSADPRRARAAEGAGARLPRRPVPPPRAARWSTRWLEPRLRRHGRQPAAAATSTPRNSRGARPHGGRTRRRQRRGGQHRHGQRQLRGAVASTR